MGTERLIFFPPRRKEAPRLHQLGGKRKRNINHLFSWRGKFRPFLSACPKKKRGEGFGRLTGRKKRSISFLFTKKGKGPSRMVLVKGGGGGKVGKVTRGVLCAIEPKGKKGGNRWISEKEVRSSKYKLRRPAGESFSFA